MLRSQLLTLSRSVQTFLKKWCCEHYARGRDNQVTVTTNSGHSWLLSLCLTSKARQTDFTLYHWLRSLLCLCHNSRHLTHLLSLTQLFSLAKHSHNLLDFKNTWSQGKKQNRDKVWECNVRIFQIVAEIPQTFSTHSFTIFTSHWHLNWFVNLHLHELYLFNLVCM